MISELDTIYQDNHGFTPLGIVQYTKISNICHIYYEIIIDIIIEVANDINVCELLGTC